MTSMQLTDAEMRRFLVLSVRTLKASVTGDYAEGQRAATELVALVEANTGEPIERGDVRDTIAQLEALLEVDSDNEATDAED